MEKLFYIDDDKDVVKVLEQLNSDIFIVKNHKDIERVLESVVKPKPIRLFLVNDEN